MAVEFVQQVKARTRSVQLDKCSVIEAVTEIYPDSDEPPSPGRPRHNSVSAVGDHAPNSEAPATGATLRPYRSMLDVEDPPNLKPLDPMSYDELYSSPVKKSCASRLP